MSQMHVGKTVDLDCGMSGAGSLKVSLGCLAIQSSALAFLAGVACDVTGSISRTCMVDGIETRHVRSIRFPIACAKTRRSNDGKSRQLFVRVRNDELWYGSVKGSAQVLNSSA